MVAMPDHVFACACQSWSRSSDPDVLETIDAAGFAHAIHGLSIPTCVEDLVQVWKVPLLC
jgi:hypothetical protein